MNPKLLPIRRHYTLARWALVALFAACTVATACGSAPSASDGMKGGLSGNAGRATSAGAGGSVSEAPPNGGSDAGGSIAGSSGASAEAGASEGGSAPSGAAGVGDPVDAGVREYPDVDFVYDPPLDAALTPDAACGLGSVEAVPAPLDMYLLFDRSGSMNLPQTMPIGSSTPGTGDCNVGDATVSRWCYSINALDAFFGSATARGTGVALQFFPAGNCAGSNSPFLYACCSSGACCSGAAEALPAVPLASLPAARSSLAAALNAQVPAADRTPIEAALRGMIAHTLAARRPERQMMGLLITDGGPEGCQSNAKSLANLLRTHRARTGIPTYVVGTQGAAFSWLETIAEAGGAPAHEDRCGGGLRPCHFYSVGSAQPDVFITVLQQIRRSAIACRFSMPSGEAGLVEPEDIALSFTVSGASAPLRLDRVEQSSACSAQGGFYYDDNDTPKNIELCASSCDEFRAHDGGKVEILLGCQGS